MESSLQAAEGELDALERGIEPQQGVHEYVVGLFPPLHTREIREHRVGELVEPLRGEFDVPLAGLRVTFVGEVDEMLNLVVGVLGRGSLFWGDHGESMISPQERGLLRNVTTGRKTAHK